MKGIIAYALGVPLLVIVLLYLTHVFWRAARPPPPVLTIG